MRGSRVIKIFKIASSHPQLFLDLQDKIISVFGEIEPNLSQNDNKNVRKDWTSVDDRGFVRYCFSYVNTISNI